MAKGAACTVILDQRFDADKGAAAPESPGNCVFDGAPGRGVMDSFNTERRMTLLVNWWKEKPYVSRVLFACAKTTPFFT